MIRLHDTLSREKVELVPRDPGRVSIYVCGPTVYEVPHVGHGRAALEFDVIRRYLEWSGFDVMFVSNVTDVEDKIIARAAEEGSTEPEVAQRYEAAYWAEMDRLGVRRPDSLPARDRVRRPHGEAHRRARRRRPRLRRRRPRRVLRRHLVSRIRRARAPAARGSARLGRCPRRRRRAQAQPGRLRALEVGQAGGAGVGLAVGQGPSRLAHRVLGDVTRPAGRGVRHPRRRRRPDLPPPRERAGPGPGRRPSLRPVLGSQRHGDGRQRRRWPSRSATSPR